MYYLPLANLVGSEGGGGMVELSFSFEGGGRLGGFIVANPSLLGAAPSLITLALLSPLAAGGGGTLPPTPPTGSLDELTTGRGPSENFLEGGAAS